MLRIIAVNDVYTLENLPRLRSLVEHHARTNPADALMVTLAGDFFAPSILSSLDSGQGMVDCMNAVGFTHVIFENHEDDIPLSELRLRIGELHATWLDTNVRDFVPPLPTHQVLEIGESGGRGVGRAKRFATARGRSRDPIWFTDSHLREVVRQNRLNCGVKSITPANMRYPPAISESAG